jgi:hypothetical protein
MRKVWLIAKLANAIIRQICAAFKERLSFEKQEHGSAQLLKYLFPSRRRSDNMKFDVHVRLQCKEICHAENPRIHGRCVLNLKRAPNGTPL